MAGRASVAMLLMLAECGTTDAPKLITLTSLTDVCAGYPELTGQRVLSLLQPVYEATYVPQSGSTSSFSLAVSYDDGQITCWPYETEGDFASVSLSVTAHATTGDGTFDDTFVGRAWLSKAAAEDGYDELNANVPVADLQGTFRPIASGWSRHFVIFAGALFPRAATAGSANTDGKISEELEDGDSVEGRNVGSWQ
jgi:hypothetical protein